MTSRSLWGDSSAFFHRLKMGDKETQIATVALAILRYARHGHCWNDGLGTLADVHFVFRWQQICRQDAHEVGGAEAAHEKEHLKT
jgi:hypothetical protein